jgi:hypothetical protein
LALPAGEAKSAGSLKNVPRLLLVWWHNPSAKFDDPSRRTGQISRALVRQGNSFLGKRAGKQQFFSFRVSSTSGLEAAGFANPAGVRIAWYLTVLTTIGQLQNPGETHAP